MKKLVVLSVCLLAVSLMFIGCGKEEAKTASKFVTIGTGGITGVYYPTGGAIAKMVNAKRKDYGIRATVESTGGSVFNINAILAGDLEFGVAQSDRQYQAVKGIADWSDKGPQEDLRAVFSIHAETVDLIAAVDAGINSIQDLKGKRINVGNVGSGYRQNAIDALEANGLNFESDFHAESLKAAEAPGLIQDGRIDAAFYTVGHPSGYYKEATAGTRKVKFIPIPNAEALVEKYPYYAAAKTLMSNYPGAENTEEAVETFGVKATFVTSAKVSDEVVYAIVKEVFENFETFKKLHPAYAGLTKESMLAGLSAPIHPGAMKYYKEAGLK
ncbi:MAG: TAXI family TRAP transporter solute-binding subunit [Desulfobacteraceae bacterium]|nr:TAXI family TRAP transporter solute-binding subunit [Desulfobacteraceae bacterium]